MSKNIYNELSDQQCEEIIGFYGVRRRIEKTRNTVYLALLFVFVALFMHVQSNDSTLAWWHITVAAMAIVSVAAYETLMSSVMTGGKNHLLNCGLPLELVQFVASNNMAEMKKRLSSTNAETPQTW